MKNGFNNPNTWRVGAKPSGDPQFGGYAVNHKGAHAWWRKAPERPLSDADRNKR